MSFCIDGYRGYIARKYSARLRNFCQRVISIFRCMQQDARGQATVEAAFALPILMILVLLLLQPAIVLYDKLIMQNAANEGLRLLTTSSYEGLDDAGLKSQNKLNEEFIQRRLSAIPQAGLFHVHENECSYVIMTEGDETSKILTVTIRNEIQPLPLIGSLASVAGLVNDRGNLVIEVSVSQASQPDWLLESVDSLNPGLWTEGG